MKLTQILREVDAAHLTLHSDTLEVFKHIDIEECRVIAKEDISAGTLLYRSRPYLTYIHGGVPSQRLLCALISLEQKDEVEKLTSPLYPRTEEEYVEYFSIRYPGVYVEDPRSYITDLKVKTNQFFTLDGKACVYNLGSRFNHGCRANCMHTVSGDNDELHVFSLRDISKGEECTIIYDHTVLSLPTDERRRILNDKFFFHCECEACVLQMNENDMMKYALRVKKIACVDKCHSCQKLSIVKQCSRCRRVKYCGMRCQKQDWKHHNEQCK